jgi:hypothetical protein
MYSLKLIWNLPLLFNPEGLLLWSLKASNEPYREPSKSNSHPNVLFKINFNIITIHA